MMHTCKRLSTRSAAFSVLTERRRFLGVEPAAADASRLVAASLARRQQQTHALGGHQRRQDDEDLAARRRRQTRRRPERQVDVITGGERRFLAAGFTATAAGAGRLSLSRRA